MTPRRRFLLLLLVPLGAAGAFAGWHLWAEHHYRQAQYVLERRDYVQAREHLARCLRVWPPRAKYYFLAARTARRAGLFDEAEQHRAACARLGWDADALKLEHALTNTQRGDLREEPPLWARVRQDHPDARLILEVLIQEYARTYRLNQAQEALDYLLERWPNDVQALLGRAWIWERLFLWGSAVKDYRRALELGPEDDAARLRFAEALLVTGPADEAAEQFERLRQRQPDHRAYALGLARALLQRGDYDAARPLLDRVLADAPDDGIALRARGVLALNEGHPAEAETWLRRAVARLPHDREARHNLFQCLAQQGKKEAADECFALLRRIDADLERLGKVVRAMVKAPHDVALRCEAGVLFLRNGEEREGRRWLLNALQMDPRYRPAHAALAEHYEGAGQGELAARHRRLARGGP